MRRFNHLLKVIMIVFITASSFSPSVCLAIEDAILAVVNDELITLKDLRDYVRGTYVALVAEGRKPEEIEKIMLDLEINGLNKLIEDKLLLSKANSLGMDVKDKLVEDKIASIKAKYGSEQEFMKALVKNGATMTDLRNKVIEQLKIAFVIDHEVKSKIYVNPAEVTQYYEDNITKFQDKEKIEVESIFIPYEADKKNAVKKANVALELIKNGESFESVAKEYSKASSLGTVERGQLLAKIEKIVFHLERGVPSEVIEVDNGAYIFLVTKKYPAQLASLNDVNDFITEYIFREKLQQQLLTWLENLKKMPTLKSSSKTIGITLGDPGGIGPEVTAAALGKTTSKNSKYKFLIIGDEIVFKHYRKRLPRNCDFHNVKVLNSRNWAIGRIRKSNGRASLEYLRTAIKLLSDGVIAGLVTAPVCKEAIVPFDPAFIGHTELLAKAARIKQVGMMFVADKMRTIIVTRHIPLKKVPSQIKVNSVYQTIMLTDRGLREQFRIKYPKIALCGLNPHAGENGLIGTEDLTQIVPAIHKARRSGVRVEGPHPADTLFVRDKSKQFDCIVAMYHDQGLIPIKTLYFNELVNLTIGLPYIRTSPAHGTAFDIAGKNLANPSSMIKSIQLAAKLAQA